jgi:mRNA-degrading endonuclease toxin of MazEF toxin-antitoxin module
MITSKKPRSNNSTYISIEKSNPEFSNTRLTKDSYIRLDRICTILKSHISARIGQICPSLILEINQKLPVMYKL